MKRLRFWMNDREALLGVVTMFVLLGLYNVFSSSFVEAQLKYETPYYFIIRHVVYLIVGIVAMFTVSVMDYRRFDTFSLLLSFVLLGALIAVLVGGEEINGARRWLKLGPVSFQPSETAKPVAIILMANFLAAKARSLRKDIGFNEEFFGYFANPQMALIVMMTVLVEREPDGMTALIIVGIPLLMIMASTMKKEYKLLLVACSALLVVLVCVLQPYRLARLKVVLDPWSEAEGAGFQAIQSITAIGSGGFFGMGIATGVSKYQYLPEAHTDFAFSVLCQEIGFIAPCLMVGLLCSFVVYGLRISRNADDVFGQYTAFGLTMLIGGQALINLMMVAGWGPVVGVPLPFISYGGTSLVTSLACVGVLLSIGRSRKKTPQEVREVVADKTMKPGKYPRLRRIK